MVMITTIMGTITTITTTGMAITTATITTTMTMIIEAKPAGRGGR